MSDPKTYTEEEVAAIAEGIRFRERVISAMLTAIQRSINAGDDPIYTNALRAVLSAQMPKPQAPPAEPDKEPDSDE